MFPNFLNNKICLYLLSVLLVPADYASTCGCKPDAIEQNKPCCEISNPCDCTKPCACVVSNTPLSAEIGRDILDRGGSAVDAAIATLFSEGVMLPHTTGIGGSCMMVIFDNESKLVRTVNGRGCAPSAAKENMFSKNQSLAEKGGLSVCVPGLVSGCALAHSEYGRIEWEDLVRPAQEIARHGFKVTRYMESVLYNERQQIQHDEGFRQLFVDPSTNCTYKVGEKIKNVQLAKSLGLIATWGAKALYDGELTENFVKDIKNLKGIIKAKDMKDYTPLWEVPVSTKLPENRFLYTASAPGSGAILVLMLNIMNGLLDLDNIHTVPNWHKVIECFKFGFGSKPELGDANLSESVNDFVDVITTKAYASSRRDQITFETHHEPEYYGATHSTPIDHGGSNIVVFGQSGDAVVVSSTINQPFGAGTMSRSTGIVLNDEMCDFSIPKPPKSVGLPPSPTNLIAPGKRPLSSMAPAIMLDGWRGCPVLGIGAGGGPKATSSIALVTARHLFFDEQIGKAICAKRLYHQFTPNIIIAESGFGDKHLRNLMRHEHEVEIKMPDGSVAVTAISKRNGILNGSFDPRRGGEVELSY